MHCWLWLWRVAQDEAPEKSKGLVGGLWIGSQGMKTVTTVKMRGPRTRWVVLGYIVLKGHLTEVNREGDLMS